MITIVSVWNEIQNKLNIVDVIGDYITVKQLGSSYKSVCPFHKDKNPSLIISPEKNLWHCFGCGAGGDMFAFVSQYENLDKAETLKKLAKKADVELVKLQPEQIEKNIETITTFELGLKYLDWSCNIYHKILLKLLENRNHPVTQYCLQRGLSIEIIKKFKIGYAFNQNTVLDLAKKHNLNLDLFENISVLKPSPKGLQDKFKDRLMIPIFDTLNKVRGFTARVLPYDKTERPKYLNSTQSEWFNKSEIWYGWNINQKSIRSNKTAILVEGNMDVIAASQKGLDVTLASQGTSFTTNQLQILTRLVKTIWIAFDNDEAGQISGRKLFLESSRLGFDVWQLLIPKKYKDLDEYLQAEFPQKVDIDKDLKAFPYIDFAINSIASELQNTQLQVQKQAIIKVLELLEFVDKITVEDTVQKIAKITNKSLSAIESLFPKNNYKKSSLPDESVADTEQTKHNEFLVRYQNLMSIISSEHTFDITKIDPEKNKTLESLFVIYSSLLPELTKFTSYEDYFTENIGVSRLISENLNTPKKTLIAAIILDINSFLQAILFDQDLTAAYQHVQQTIKKL